MKLVLILLPITAILAVACACGPALAPAPTADVGGAQTPAPTAEAGGSQTTAPIAEDGGSQTTAPPIATEPGLKVAFIGDSGYGEDFRAVLRLIKAEGADLVLDQGDFDYAEDADGFFAAVDSVLGADFPFLAAVGNHDDESWPEGCDDRDGCYAEFLKDRMSRTGITPDDPDLNDQMYAVEYRGLKIVFVGEEYSQRKDCDDDPRGYACFIRKQLTDDQHIWKICSWHELQKLMQVGNAGDEMGWAVYENCRDLGAVIATAHEHSYQRTKTLLSLEHPIVDPYQHPTVDGVPSNPNSVRVAPGATFGFVSGLGGSSMRTQKRCLPATYPYGCNYEWASIYTERQTGGEERFGALFIEFNVGGDPYKARGYFKNTLGEVIDLFDVTAAVPPPPPEPNAG